MTEHQGAGPSKGGSAAEHLRFGSAKLTPNEAFELHVLRRLSRGADWSQRFPKLKPIIDRLQDRGLVRRLPAPGSRVPLMIEITDAGITSLSALRRKDAA